MEKDALYRFRNQDDYLPGKHFDTKQSGDDNFLIHSAGNIDDCMQVNYCLSPRIIAFPVSGKAVTAPFSPRTKSWQGETGSILIAR